MVVIKKDGLKEDWNNQKIIDAIKKASLRCESSITKEQAEEVANKVFLLVQKLGNVHTLDLHSMVIDQLKLSGFDKIANAYQEYRDYKNTYAKSWEELKQQTDAILFLGDRENANFDSSLISTKGALMKGALAKELYKQFYLSKTEKEMIKRGDIYIHDLRDMIFNSINCFASETKFITNKGLKSFNDFKDGDSVIVPTHLGNWKKAIVHCYGKRKLNKIGLYRSRGEVTYVYCTANHRWLLKDNVETTNVQIGDILTNTPKLTDFNWEYLSPEEKIMWCWGFLFGDGTQSHSTSCTIRLCGDKAKYANRFEECGYIVTVPNNTGWGGDPVVYMHDTSKSIPPLEFMTRKDILLFINGYLSADGGKELRNSTRSFRCLQITNTSENIDIIYSLLHTAGYYVSNIRDLTENTTNFGTRSNLTKYFCLYEEAKERTSWRVDSIEETTREEDVWCLEVEDDHSFILEKGIPTGNCCLFDMGNVLKGGFEMSNTKYTEPKSVLTALQVIGDITMVASASQFGGFSTCEVDKMLLPYVKKSLSHWFSFFTIECELEKDKAMKLAKDKVREELKQGFQSYELKLNTLPSSRGDYPFTTITFMQWDPNLPEEDRYWLAEIDKIILKTRYVGHDNKPALFPKLVALFDKNQYDLDPYTREVFDECIYCSSKCLYPDMLSLIGNSGKNTVAKVYLDSNKQVITSPMGCRAYLSPWKDPETDKYVTIGRCNIGAVSLNICLIMAIAKKEYGEHWKDHFWDLLEYRLEVIRGFFKKRYEAIRHTKCSTNPMAFCQGGFYHGTKDPDEEIGDLVQYMTASFGFIGLNEATILWNGHTIAEDNSFAKEFLNFLQEKLNYYKKEDGHLYAIYATPAESYQQTSVKAYEAYSGDTQFGEYFTNGFHCHVNEDITPFEKQDKEVECFHLSPGGHISYGRIDNPDNLEAIKATYLRAMELGYYYGVNFDAGYCQDCGTQFHNCTIECPNCHSKNIVVIDRVTGYLGYSNINGTTRFNDGLLANLHDRKSM